MKNNFERRTFNFFGRSLRAGLSAISLLAHSQRMPLQSLTQQATSNELQALGKVTEPVEVPNFYPQQTHSQFPKSPTPQHLKKWTKSVDFYYLCRRKFLIDATGVTSLQF